MKDMFSVIRGPIITEKATLQKELGNQIAFRVDPHANKIEIKNAVEKIFKVKVMTVQTVNRKGKPKRVGRHMGRRANTKKAIVRLFPGETIDFFEGA